MFAMSNKHRDFTKVDPEEHKAFGYCAAQKVWPDLDLLYQACWECTVDREDFVPYQENKDRQWVQPLDTIWFDALWVRAIPVSEIDYQYLVSTVFHPFLESDPTEWAETIQKQMKERKMIREQKLWARDEWNEGQHPERIPESVLQKPKTRWSKIQE